MHFPAPGPLADTMTFEVPAYAVGPDRRLRPAYLIRLFQEAARRNTTRLDLESTMLNERYGLTWVLHRQAIDIHHWPTLGQAVNVVTYPTRVARGLITYRDFFLLSEDGTECYVTAATSWSTLDIRTRKLTKLPTAVLAVFDDAPAAASHLPWPETKPTAPEPQPNNGRSFRVGFADLDFNDHLTNSAYPDLMLECLGYDYLSTHSPRTIDVVYQKEARYGDTLRAIHSPGGSKHSFHHALLRGETELALMRTTFAPAAAPKTP